MQSARTRRPSWTRAAPVASVAALVAACGPVAPPPVDDPPPPVGARPASPDRPRLWVASPGLEERSLILEGPAVAPGTVVEVFDAAGAACEAEVSSDPPPDCDDCVRERFLARTGEDCRPLEGALLVLRSPLDRPAVVGRSEYPALATLNEEPVTWASVDLEGDGAVDAELVVWCGLFLPSGCDGRACAEVCRGVRVPGEGEPADVLCERFIPDVEDCVPAEQDCVLVEGGCQSCGTDCRDITLTVPQAERWATYESEGVGMEFDLEDVRAVAAELEYSEVQEWLAAHAGTTGRIDLQRADRALGGQWVPGVIGALLERGRARVVDPGDGEPVERLVQMEWFWMGCGGRCRQSGREWRLRVPGEVFFKTTDLFGD